MTRSLQLLAVGALLGALVTLALVARLILHWGDRGYHGG